MQFMRRTVYVAYDDTCISVIDIPILKQEMHAIKGIVDPPEPCTSVRYIVVVSDLYVCIRTAVIQTYIHT
jgi:hypothetical protein